MVVEFVAVDGMQYFIFEQVGMCFINVNLDLRSWKPNMLEKGWNLRELNYISGGSI